jgi:hypothetical protein
MMLTANIGRMKTILSLFNSLNVRSSKPWRLAFQKFSVGTAATIQVP